MEQLNTVFENIGKSFKDVFFKASEKDADKDQLVKDLNASIKAEKEALTVEFEKMNTEIEGLKTSKAELENKVETLEASKTTLETEVEELKTAKATAENEVETLKGNATELEAENTELKEANAKLSEASEGQALKIKTLEDEISKEDEVLSGSDMIAKARQNIAERNSTED